MCSGYVFRIVPEHISEHILSYSENISEHISEHILCLNTYVPEHIFFQIDTRNTYFWTPITYFAKSEHIPRDMCSDMCSDFRVCYGKYSIYVFRYVFRGVCVQDLWHTCSRYVFKIFQKVCVGDLQDMCSRYVFKIFQQICVGDMISAQGENMKWKYVFSVCDQHMYWEYVLVICVQRI